MSSNIQLVEKRNLFGPTDIEKDIRVVEYRGETLEELRLRHFPDSVDCVVSVNGGIVTDADCATRTLMPNDSVLFVPKIHGGDDGKQIFASIAMIAIALAAPYAASWMLGYGWSLGLSMSALGAPLMTTMLSAAITMVGGMLVSAFLKPNPAAPDLPSRIDSERSRAYSWNPSTTQEQGTFVSEMFGLTKPHGNVIAYDIETIDDKQYYNILLSLGAGPVRRLFDYKINDQPVENIQGVEIHTRLGKLNQVMIPNFNDTKVVDGPVSPVLIHHCAEVVGTDGAWYRCKVGHTPSSGNRPVSGSWQTYWEKTCDKWARNTTYAKNDYVVGSDAAKYICKVDHTSGNNDEQRPGDGYLAGAYWGLCDTCDSWTDAQGTQYYAPYVYTTVASSFNQIEVDVSWPGLIAYNSETGDEVDRESRFAIQVKKHSESDWSTLTISPWTTTTAVTAGYWSCGVWINPEAPMWYEAAPGSDNPYEPGMFDGKDGGSAYLPGGEFAMPVTWRWIATTTYDTVSHIVDWTAVTARQATQVIRTYKTNTKLRAGQYDVRIIKKSQDTSSNVVKDDLYISAVRTVLLDDFEYPGQVLVGIRALASDQISGSLNFSCKCEGHLVRVYDGANWTIQYRNNNAWVCYHVLTRPVLIDIWEPDCAYALGDTVVPTTLNTRKYVCTTAGVSGSAEPASWTTTAGNTVTSGTAVFTCAANTAGDGVHRFDGWSPSRVDLATLKEWADYCDEMVTLPDGTTEKRHQFDGTFDSSSSMWEAALKIGLVGDATLVWRGSTIYFVIDRAVSPVHLYSMGNIAKSSFKKSFLPLQDRASRLEITFLNQDNDLQKDKQLIVNPRITTDNIVTLDLFGVIRESEAWRNGMKMLKQNELVLRTIEFETDIDAIGHTVGEVVNFQHDLPSWGNGKGGRTIEATANTVTLDTPVTIATGKTYQIKIKHGVGHEVLGTDGKIWHCIVSHEAAAATRPTSGGQHPTRWETVAVPWADSTYYDLRNEVVGSDSKKYRCVSPHTSSPHTKPITGASWAMFWELESTPETWTSGKNYIPPDYVTTKTVNNSVLGELTTLTVTSNFDLIPSPFDVYAFGETDILTKPFRMISIERSQDVKFKHVGTEYRPELYTDLHGQFTVIRSNQYTAIDVMPVIDGNTIQAEPKIKIDATGSFAIEVELTFRKPSVATFGYAKIYRRDVTNEGLWIYDGRTLTHRYDARGLTLGTVYEFAFVTVNTAGIEDVFANAPVKSVTVPSVPSGFTFSPGATTVTVSQVQGVGLYTSISDAIDALPPQGGVVYVKSGVHVVPTINLPNKDILILGENRDSVVLCNVAGDEMFNGDALTCSFGIKDLTIQSVNTSTRRIMLDFVVGAAHIAIENIKFKLTGDGIENANHDTGVYFDGSLGTFRVAGCMVENGILLSFGNVLDLVCENNIGVSQFCAITSAGVSSQAGSRIFIRGNSFTGVHGPFGIRCDGYPIGTVFLHDNTVEFTTGAASFPVNPFGFQGIRVTSGNVSVCGNSVKIVNSVLTKPWFLATGISVETDLGNINSGSRVAGNVVYIELANVAVTWMTGMMGYFDNTTAVGNSFRIDNLTDSESACGIRVLGSGNHIEANHIDMFDAENTKNVGIWLVAGASDNRGNNTIINSYVAVRDLGTNNKINLTDGGEL